MSKMSKIRFATIGVAIHGRRHVEGIIANKYTELVAICDIDEKTLNEVGDSYGIEYRTTDYRELVDKNLIDAVCIVTPDQIHKEMVLAFLNEGIHVLCEKPLALHSDECEAMIEAEKKSNAMLMVGQVCRKTPGFIKAKEIVDLGLIGNLLFVESEYAHDYSNMGPHWRTDKEKPRHPVTGGGCHAVDLLRWLAGDPIEAYGYTNKKSLDDIWPCDDSAIAVLKFPNDVMGKVFVSTGCKRAYTMRTVIYGTKGTIITDNKSPNLTLYLDEFEGKKEFLGSTMHDIAMEIPVTVNDHNVTGEIDDFAEIIAGRKELEITGYEGAATVAVCEAIIASAESGKPEKIKYIKQ